MRSGIIHTVLVAILLAVVVAVVFSLIEAIDQYAGAAGLLTFILVLLSAFAGHGTRI